MATTLIISQLLDSLVAVIEPARTATAGDSRWLNALENGYNWLLQQDTILFDLDHHELTVPSATTEGRTYRANGSCQCKAFEQHNACWHRAAARLVRRAREYRAQQAVAAVEALEHEQRERKREDALLRVMECFA